MNTDNPIKLYGFTPQIAVRCRAEAYLKLAAPGPCRERTKLRQRARKFVIRVLGTLIMPDTVDDVGPQRPELLDGRYDPGGDPAR